jgi:hypothetical protein
MKARSIWRAANDLAAELAAIGSSDAVAWSTSDLGDIQTVCHANNIAQFFFVSGKQIILLQGCFDSSLLNYNLNCNDQRDSL